MRVLWGQEELSPQNSVQLQPMKLLLKELDLGREGGREEERVGGKGGRRGGV